MAGTHNSGTHRKTKITGQGIFYPVVNAGLIILCTFKFLQMDGKKPIISENCDITLVKQIAVRIVRYHFLKCATISDRISWTPLTFIDQLSSLIAVRMSPGKSDSISSLKK